MSNVLILALKDLRILWRDRTRLFWALAFPLLMALFFGSVFSSGGGSETAAMKVAAVDESGTRRSQAFFNQLAQSSALSVSPMSRDSARVLVIQGKLTAYVALTDSGAPSRSLFGGRMPAIEIGVDPSRKAEAGYLQGLVSQAFYTLLQQQMTDPAQLHEWAQKSLGYLDAAQGLPATTRHALKRLMNSLDTLATTIKPDGMQQSSPFGALNVRIVEVRAKADMPHSAYEVSFPQAIMWGLIAVSASFALSIVSERTRGTYLRLRMMPLGRVHILAGKGLACFVAGVLVCVVLMGLGRLMFDVRIENMLGLIMAIGGSALCFVGIMMMSSVLGKTEQAVSGASWAILLLMSMTGGGMIPLMFMPSWMLAISNFSPVKWGILALEGAVWRGFTSAEMILPVSILVAIGAATFAAGVIILARADR